MFSSVLVRNRGEQILEVQKLPKLLQSSSVHTFGKLNENDVYFCGGNDYGYAPLAGRIDGSRGQRFTISGDSVKIFPAGGLYIEGKIRGMVPIDTSDDIRRWMIIRNNDRPVILTRSRETFGI